MSAAMASVPTVYAPAARSVLARLARIEAIRYARHPVFLIGFVLALASSAGTYGPTELDHQVVPAFFLGVLGLVVAARLASATDETKPVVAAAPVSETLRTAALCIACAVPAAAGAVVVLFHRAFVLADPQPDYIYAGYSAADRVWITLAIPVIACAGGPLLGIVVGRWLRFRGATLLAVLVLLEWSRIGAYIPAQRMDADSTAARALHMLTPYTAFLETDANSNALPTVVTSYTGSPFWFMVWTLALCGLACSAALWHGARRSSRASVRRNVGGAFVGCLAVAAVAVVLAASTGASHLTYWTQDGSSSSAKPADG
jgi:hypothetical protein